MNTLIETLNHWGESVLTFAWPMLWQSSLLIAVVAALDFLFARKIRAAIRHALWLVVLLKLLLPPALALPTGAAWWLWPAKPSLTPLIQSETVSFDTAPPEDFVPQTAPIALPPPKLDGAAWTLLLSGAMSAGLFAWLAVNWLKVTRKTHRPPAPVGAPGDFASALEQARQLAGLRGPMRLRLVNDTLSPALYGLFRPVILLPRALAEKLSAAQLRAVLVHEAVHLRRGDVWVNCAQTLLQIGYWWHPLLWLANARIRRLREEAVDDAVMLALRGDAEAYAPTLLEVAKFAFRRPLASLGLVGILESRSALRQRVERLVDFRPPRRAGVTFLSLCGIFLFSAIALPMGQGPAAENNTTLSNTAMAPPQSGIYAPVNTPSAVTPAGVTNIVFPQAGILIEGHFLWMQSRDVETLTVGLPHHYGQVSGASDWMAATNAKALAVINQRMHSLNLRPVGTPRIVDIPGNAASIYVGNDTNWYKFNCTPVTAGDHIDLAFQTEFASVSSSGKTNRVELNGDTMVNNNGGLVLYAQKPDDATSNLVLIIHVKIIVPVSAHSALPKADAALSPSAISTSADSPDGVAAAGAANKYEMRTFKVDPDKLLSSLKERLPASFYTMPNSHTEGFSWIAPGLITLAREYFQKQGINLDPPKTMFFNDRLGVLFVYATSRDMDAIERILDVMNVGTITAAAKTKFFINPTNVLDPQQNDENHYSKQWAGDSLLSGKEYFEPGPPEHVSVPVKVTDLQQKVFYVSTAAFYAAVHRLTDEPNGLSGFKKIIANAGVDLSPPKTIFISEGTGGLFVYATTNDIAIIKDIIDGFDCPPAQVHIKARFIEIPQKAFAQLQEQYLQQGMSNGIARLTNPQFQVFLHEVQQQPGTEELAEPEVTTLAGRQTQMRTTITQPIVTDFTLGAPTSRHAPVDPQIDEIETSGGYFYAQHHRLDPQITQLETGPMLDVIALAPADGYTLSLRVIASDTQFFGYASPKGLASHTVTNRDGDKVELPVVLPEVELDQASVQQVSLYDGQSMVLFPQPRQETFTGLDDEAQQRMADGIQKIRENNGNKVLIAVVTATFIDRAGNRVHSDDQIPFAQTQLPPPWP